MIWIFGALFLALTVWVMWSLLGWGNLALRAHVHDAVVKRRRTRAFAAMGCWQIGIGIVLVVFATQNGTSVWSNAPALFLLGFGFLVAAHVTKA